MAYNQFDFNVPEVPRAHIAGLPSQGVAAYKGSPDSAVDFCAALRGKMVDCQHGECVFDNIDVSQVEWNALSFSVLLDVLTDKGASTKRLKAFKCGLDDECITQIASWLDTLQPEGMPSEIHLSNNKFGREGFEALLASLEAKRAELPEQAPPIWVRVENNGVDDAFLKELVAQGKIVYVTKIGDRRKGSEVMAMPSFAGSGARDRQPQWPAARGAAGGSPPWSGGGLVGPGGCGNKGCKGGGNGWQGQNRGAQWGGGGGGEDWRGGGGGSSPWSKPAGTSWDAGGWRSPAQQALSPGSIGKGAKGAGQSPHPTASRPVFQSLHSAGRVAATGGGAVRGGTADRSRTPGARTAAPPKKPPADQPALPAGWEKHWSEEYQIPYFWNKESGESLWEPPQ